MLRSYTVALALGLAVVVSSTAHAKPKGVGLGVAIGPAYSPTKGVDPRNSDRVGLRLAWGFFVDIPLLDTFFITPAAMLYEMDTGTGSHPVTDIDLNFKFIVPIGSVRLGAGMTGGLTVGMGDYAAHVGALGYFSYSLVENLELFILAQYKRLWRDGTDVDDIHALAGPMFRF